MWHHLDVAQCSTPPPPHTHPGGLCCRQPHGTVAAGSGALSRHHPIAVHPHSLGTSTFARSRCPARAAADVCPLLPAQPGPVLPLQARQRACGWVRRLPDHHQPTLSQRGGLSTTAVAGSNRAHQHSGEWWRSMSARLPTVAPCLAGCLPHLTPEEACSCWYRMWGVGKRYSGTCFPISSSPYLQAAAQSVPPPTCRSGCKSSRSTDSLRRARGRCSTCAALACSWRSWRHALVRLCPWLGGTSRSRNRRAVIWGSCGTGMRCVRHI